MSTILAVYCGDQCIGRCDERCYDAKGDDCDCICRGRLHKAGRASASAMSRGLLRELTPAEINDFLVNAGHMHLDSDMVQVTRGPRGSAKAKAAKKARQAKTPEEKAQELVEARERNTALRASASKALGIA